MDARTRAELVQALRRQRATLLKQFVHVEADIQSISEDREPEIEEPPQGERTARVLALDDRSLLTNRTIRAAAGRVTSRGCPGHVIDVARRGPLVGAESPALAHPLVLLYALSGSATMSAGVRIPKP
jgi:hypothetical protein